MNIGSLAVNITATTEKFTKGINSARGMMGKFTSGITAAQGIVSAFVVGSLGSIVHSAIEAGSALYEMTQKTHVAAEQLSALHFAADQLESSAGAVDSAIQFMTKTLGKAVQGSDPAIEAFNRLNIDLEKLKNLSPDQQFLSIIDALHKIKDPALAAADAQGIFGRGAKELTPLIAAGTDAIIAQGQAAADTGNILSTETVAGLDEAGDAIKRLTGAWAAAKTTLVGEFAPEIVNFVDFLYGVGTATKLAAYSIQFVWTGVLKAVSVILLKFSTLWNALAPAFAEIDTGRFSAINEDLDKVLKGLNTRAQATISGSAFDNPLAKSATDISGHVATGKEDKAAAQLEKQATKQTAKDKKEEEKKTAANTKASADALKELVNYSKQRGPVLAISGIR